MSDPLIPTDFITFEQYLADETISPHSEWVDGIVVSMHAVSDRHDEVVGWLRELLGAYVRERGLGRVFGEPFVMKIGPDLPGRSPDLMFVRADRLHLVEKMCLRGPADLAIEVISGGSRTVDRLHKFAEYEDGGVAEYWLIDPERDAAHFWQLRGGCYVEVKPTDGRYESAALPGAPLRVAWLGEKPLPRTLPILREWGLI